MNRARKKFVMYAMAAIFVLLAVLLGVINGVNYAMAGEDADEITQTLAEGRGSFSGFRPRDGVNTRNGRPAQMGPMGPNSPEMAHSLRFFTVAFDQSGSGKIVSYEIAAVSREDAVSWAESLKSGPATGWTGRTYRYRVYDSGGKTYVTVIDQGRELLPAFRIFIISLIGLAVGLAVSCGALMYFGKRLFQPLEEADRKQKRFIADVEKEFKVPLTIMNANTEILERENGETEQTRSINRQLKRMTALVKDLGSLGVFDGREMRKTRCDLSALAQAAVDALKPQFQARGCAVRLFAGDGVTVNGDVEAMSDMMAELADNALKYSASWAEVRVSQENGRVTVSASNDTTLPSGAVDQVFDRFTRLENAKDAPGAGLGLSHVKEIVRAHNGRASARVADGIFTIRVNL